VAPNGQSVTAFNLLNNWQLEMGDGQWTLHLVVAERQFREGASSNPK
jgi:hypothetical protein